MAGRVIQALRHSVLAPPLSEAELRAVANCGRIESYDPGAAIIPADGLDERVYLLQEGDVRLSIFMGSEGGHCGGEASFELTTPGEAFGWGWWVRSERIKATAAARDAATLVVLDLRNLGDAATLLKVSQRMVFLLYARLQEGGVCPPDVQGLLKWQHSLHAQREERVVR